MTLDQKPALLPSLVAFAAVTLLVSAIYVIKIQRGMVDFAVYRQAAGRALSGQSLYRESDGHYQFKYLPAFALVMAPFAWLPSEAAKLAWFTLSLALLATFVRWSVLTVPDPRRSNATLGIASLLFLGKFYGKELTFGQANVVLAALSMGALIGGRARRPRLAGALVGLGVFVKPYAVVLLPWLALATGRSGVLAFFVVVALGLVAPMAVYGWQGNLTQLAAWVHTITASSTPNLLTADNISVAAMWAKWLGTGPLAAWLALVTGAALVGLVVMVIWRRSAAKAPEYLEFAMLMLLIPLLSPQGWDYVLLLATPAVVCLVDRLNEMARTWQVVTVAALGVMGLTIFDVLGRTLYFAVMRLSIVSVCALVLAAVLARLRWRALA